MLPEVLRSNTSSFFFSSLLFFPVLPEAGGESQGSDGALAPVKPEVSLSLSLSFVLSLYLSFVFVLCPLK